MSTRGFLVAMSCQSKFTPMAFLMRYLPNLMCSTPPVFQDIKLTTMDYSKGRVLGPHCQCASKFENKGAAIATVKIYAKRKPKKKLQVLQVRVPHWANRKLTDVVMSDGLILPRHQELPSRMPQPGTSFAKPGTFRHHLQSDPGASCPRHPFGRDGNRCTCSWSSRCQIPSQFYADFKSLMQGLASGYAYIRMFKKEMAMVLGPVGINSGMADMADAMRIAWNWSELAVHEPKDSHSNAFWFLFEQLSPFLQHCLWPDPTKYPMKRRHWNLDKSEGIRQYKLLLARVRAAFNAKRAVPKEVLTHGGAASWRKVVRATIKPVRTWGILRHCVGVFLERCGSMGAGSPLLCQVVSSKVMEYMGHAQELLGPTDFAAFEVSPKDLRDVRVPCRYLCFQSVMSTFHKSWSHFRLVPVLLPRC